MTNKQIFKSLHTASPTLAEPIVETILDLIRNGELQEGAKLPPQDVMAEQLSVSRTSLREALKELTYRGVIDCIHGKGTFVSKRLASATEIIEARRVIEPGVASLAALRATGEDCRLLSQIVGAMKEKVEKYDFKGFSILDLEFHMKINEMSGNQALILVMQTLRDVMLVQQLYIQKLPGAIERAYEFHKRILADIEKGDSEAAYRTMKEHLDDVEGAAQQDMIEEAACP